MAKQFSTQELVERWEDHRAIENLMGRRTFRHILKQDAGIWNEYWCRKASDPCLCFNDGAYCGYEALDAYFKAVEELTALQTSCVKKANPQLEGKSEEELFGVGSLEVDSLSTPVIELAEDGLTAKGLWYLGGGNFEILSCGPVSRWNWGRVGADFVKEDGEWKIWHMFFAIDINCITGSSWEKENPSRLPDEVPEYAAIGAFELPKPNVSEPMYEYWNQKRSVREGLPVPMPYASFSETFSYGLQVVHV